DVDGKPLEFEATGWFARVMQHEYDHLDGRLSVDRLNERWGKRARKQVKKEGWGVPGLTWLPGTDPDPFGH
ncbi:peptide deformylase, partial [Arthrobacter deserti]|nr:peptide deformylase [Arthrobacter deserti]